MGATGWDGDAVWARQVPARQDAERFRSAAPPGVAAPAAPAAPTAPTSTVHEAVRSTPEFAELRRRQRRFVFPVTVAFLLWYLAYVLLACYARDLMAVPVADGINLGLVIGLLQFVSTFAISTAYVVYARTRLDPLAERLRERVESGAVAGPPAPGPPAPRPPTAGPPVAGPPVLRPPVLGPPTPARPAHRLFDGPGGAR